MQEFESLISFNYWLDQWEVSSVRLVDAERITANFFFRARAARYARSPKRIRAAFARHEAQQHRLHEIVCV